MDNIRWPVVMPVFAPTPTEEYEITVVRSIEQFQKIKVTVAANDPSPRMEARKRAVAEATAWGKWTDRSVSEPITETIRKIEL